MHKLIDTIAVALDAFDKGYVPIPCAGKKIPLVPWKEFQTTFPTVELVREWFSDTRVNIGILTNDLVLFDCDDPELAKLVIEHCGETPHVIRTPRGGFHLGYRRRKGVVVGNRVKIKDLDIDIRELGGIEVIPESFTEHGRYEWLGSGLRPICELPFGNIGWTRERVKKRVQGVVVESGDVMVRRAMAWAACVEGAISGQGGHNKTFRLCCRLTHYDEHPKCFGLSFDQAWPILLEWNEQCEPPWLEKELTHKLEDAIKKRR